MKIEVKHVTNGRPFRVPVMFRELLNKQYGEDFYETSKMLQQDRVRDPLPKAKYKLWS